MVDYASPVARIRDATAVFDRTAATAACSELIARIQSDDQPAPVQPLKQALSALRNKCYFDLMEQVADAAIQSGQVDPQVRRQYAQSLIDQGRISAAVNVLKVLTIDTADGPLKNPSEHAEARGLLGRAHKQSYVNAVNGSANTSAVDPAAATPARRSRADANRRQIDAAVKAYYEGYGSDRDRYLWHGINTVACLCRAERDGLALEGYPNPRDIASEVLATIEAVTPRSKVATWDWATAVEACVALDRLADALEWLASYVKDPGADAFELASTLRQLTEVWELTSASDPGRTILPVLRSELLRRQGGGFEFSAHPQNGSPVPQEAKAVGVTIAKEATLEAVLGDTRFLSLKWYQTGLKRCEAVARIETQWGKACGSGFLVRGEDLHRVFTGEILLLTNAHVISDDPVVQRTIQSLSPEQAVVSFEAREAAKKYAIKNVLWTSPPGDLDATLLRLEDSLTLDPPYPLAIALPVKEKDRVYVIGHPEGGPLSFSMQDNRVVDVKAPRIQYRAPTARGSSGSPVFNDNWQLLALHHAGSKQMTPLAGTDAVEANEGIWITAVVTALAEKFDLPKAPGGPD